MTYENTTVRDLYSSCLSSLSETQEQALAWVEAQNVEATWLVVRKWFVWMQNGDAQYKFPDPTWDDAQHPGRRPLTQTVGDELVKEMDEDFLIERNRFPRETGLGPEFSRLPPHARLAMAQDLYGVIRTREELRGEARKLIDSGVKEFPPRTWSPRSA